MKADESRAYTAGFADGFKRGREDAVEEFEREYASCLGWGCDKVISCVKCIAEQIKEQKNDT